ncbi:MAG TPA: hypothetical protein VFE10_03390 [Phenylobacterium sp.]|jgi:hypothetical protein|nr:hypothetical protein [Phenylobacterium sp.]
MSKRKEPVEEPEAAAVTGEPAILARLDSGPGWGSLLAAGGLAVVAGLGVLVFRGFRRRKT